MARRAISFRAWHRDLGPAVPLRVVPDLLRTSPDRVRRLVEQGVLSVHTFPARDARRLRYVTLADLRSAVRLTQTRATGLTIDGMRRAVEQMLDD